MSRISVKETDIQILTDKPINKKFLKERTLIYRNQIEDYISKEKRFLTNLKPLTVSRDTSVLIKNMARVSKLVNVGPMATVAGAIAQYLAKDLIKKGFKEIIVENGGDIFLKIKKIRFVSIFSGKSKLSNKIFLKINPKDSPLGICTSSATVGHSLSFGNADAVTIVAKDAILADALATAACNLVKTDRDFKKVVEFVKKFKEIVGVIIVLGEKLASWGEIKFA